MNDSSEKLAKSKEDATRKLTITDSPVKIKRSEEAKMGNKDIGAENITKTARIDEEKEAKRLDAILDAVSVLY